jgi:hypothetical protein
MQVGIRSQIAGGDRIVERCGVGAQLACVSCLLQKANECGCEVLMAQMPWRRPLNTTRTITPTPTTSRGLAVVAMNRPHPP